MLSGPQFAAIGRSPPGPSDAADPSDPATRRTLAIANLRRAASHRQQQPQSSPSIPAPQQLSHPHPPAEPSTPYEHPRQPGSIDHEGVEHVEGGAVQGDHDDDTDDLDLQLGDQDQVELDQTIIDYEANDPDDPAHPSSDDLLNIDPGTAGDMTPQMQMQQLLQTQQQIQQLQAALLAQGLPAHLVYSTGASPAPIPALSPPANNHLYPDLHNPSPTLPSLLNLLPSSSPGVPGLGLGYASAGMGLNSSISLGQQLGRTAPSLTTAAPNSTSALGVPQFATSPVGTSPVSPSGLGPTTTGSSGGSHLLAPPTPQATSPRSPLPSLEQLRARILNERHQQSLRRSASTSAAAHAVARAHALEKLIGAGAGISQRRALSPTDHLEAGRNRARRRTLLGHPSALDEEDEAGADEDEHSDRRSTQFGTGPEDTSISVIITEEDDEDSDNSEDEDLWGDALHSEKRASRIPLSQSLNPLLIPSSSEGVDVPRGRPVSVRPLRQESTTSHASNTSFVPRPLLRRSRTIGGLTAMAEQERRNEFLESLLTPEEQEAVNQAATPASPPPLPSPPVDPPVDTPRMAARAQLLRKLSSRAPGGRPSTTEAHVFPTKQQPAQASTSPHAQANTSDRPTPTPTPIASRPLSTGQGNRMSMLRRRSGSSELSEVSGSEGHEGIDDAYLNRVDQMADELSRFTEESATRARATNSLSSTAGASSVGAIAAARSSASIRQPELNSEADLSFPRAATFGSSASLNYVSPAEIVRSPSSSTGLQQLSQQSSRSIHFSPHTRTQSASSPWSHFAQLRLSPPASPTKRSPSRSPVPALRGTPTGAIHTPTPPQASSPSPASSSANVGRLYAPPPPVASTPILSVPNTLSPSTTQVPLPPSPLSPPERPNLVPDPAIHHLERANSHLNADRSASHLTPDRSPSLLTRTHSQSGRLKRSIFGSLRRKKVPDPLSMKDASGSSSDRNAPFAWQNRHALPSIPVPSTLAPPPAAHAGRRPSPTLNTPATPTTPDSSWDTSLMQRTPPNSASSTATPDGLQAHMAERLRNYARILSAVSLPANVPGIPPNVLSSSPRQLLRAVPVFQVVTASGIKDRFLFVFNDVVVIAKPVAAPEGGGMMLGMADLGWLFSVKAILETRSLRLAIPRDQGCEPARPHPLIKTLVDRFPSDPEGAIADVMARSGLPPTPDSVAQLLTQTTDLDKDALTQYLCDSRDPRRTAVMDAYIGCQRLLGVSVESALRAILLGLRYPQCYAGLERLLQSFVVHWLEANANFVKPGFTKAIAFALVVDIFRLNDALHGYDPAAMAPRYSYPQGPSTPTWDRNTKVHAFVAQVRQVAPDNILSDTTLARIYESIRAEPLAVALAANEPPPLPVYLSTPLPTRMIYGQPSVSITVTIPRPDPEFAIRLYGPGRDIVFEPSVLRFEHSRSCSFTMTSRVLGPKEVVFVRARRRSRYYAGAVPSGDTTAVPSTAIPLPRSAPVTVERAFMQHTFVLDASGGSGQSHRYILSLEDGEKLASVTDAMAAQIDSVRRTGPTPAQQQVDNLALDVLRNALIDTSEDGDTSVLQRSASVGGPTAPPPSNIPPATKRTAPATPSHSGNSSIVPVNAPSSGLSRGNTLRQAWGGLTRRLDRAASTSHARQAFGRSDSVRDPERNGQAALVPPTPVPDPSKALGAPATLTGSEIVALCQHNSLLPYVQEYLGA